MYNTKEISSNLLEASAGRTIVDLLWALRQGRLFVLSAAAGAEAKIEAIIQAGGETRTPTGVRPEARATHLSNMTNSVSETSTGNGECLCGNELAARYQLHVESVHRMIRGRGINDIKFGRQWRGPLGELDRIGKAGGA